MFQVKKLSSVDTIEQFGLISQITCTVMDLQLKSIGQNILEGLKADMCSLWLYQFLQKREYTTDYLLQLFMIMRGIERLDVT